MKDVLREHKDTSKSFTPKRGKMAGHLPVVMRRTKKAERLLGLKRSAALNSPRGKKYWNDPKVKNLLSSFKGSVAFALADAPKQPHVKDLLHALLDMNLLPDPGKMELTPHDMLALYQGPELEKQKSKVVFRFMDLPVRLRRQIYEHVLVESKVFVRPDNGGTGREQPDLAMVCKQIRKEALPVFYGKNVFAIQLPLERTTTQPKAKYEGFGPRRVEVEPAAPWGTDAELWSRAIDADPDKPSDRFEEEGWIKDIRHIVFDCSSRHSQEPVFLSVKFKKDSEAGAWGATIEVHREASCIMSGIEDRAACRVRLTPGWINELVIDLCDDANGRELAAQQILYLARAFEPRMAELMNGRCADAAGVRQQIGDRRQVEK